MKFILITGSAGFIGTNLCIRLLEDPNNFVYGVDNYLTSLPNDFNCIKHPRYQFIKCDIISEINLLSNIEHIDEIYNLASIASPPKYKMYPIETLDVNIIGTRNVLDLAVKHRSKFILTSTSEVYGDPLEHPQKETYYGNVNTVGERSCYDESKRCAETYVYEYRKKTGMDLKICRIFNTYGPYMDINDGRVITNFIKNILINKPVEICGDGNQTRSFCFIDDMLNGLMLLMASDEAGPMNLGNPNTEFTLNELHTLFEEILCITIYKKYIGLTENDPKCRKPDITMANKNIGFNPTCTLKEGIRKTFMFYASSK